MCSSLASVFFRNFIFRALDFQFWQILQCTATWFSENSNITLTPTLPLHNEWCVSSPRKKLVRKMGAGRKTERHILRDTVPRIRGANSSVTARNLGKKRLAGVIFGTTHYTIKECLTKLVFGLPAGHFSYIKHIDPGLPLFLFNYSDRKLHRIFEAASHGKMNINPYGWTTNGSDQTEFPAQVRVRVRKQCGSLTEEQYKKVLHRNYSEDQKHFRFELDHSQTSQLLALFESLPSTKSIATSSKNSVTSLDEQCEEDYLKSKMPVALEPCTEHYVTDFDVPADLPKPTRTWSSLFKNFAFDSKKKDDDKPIPKSNWGEYEDSGVTPLWGEAAASSATPCPKEEAHINKNQEENVAAEDEEEPLFCKLKPVAFINCKNFEPKENAETTNEEYPNAAKGAWDGFIPCGTGSSGLIYGEASAASSTMENENAEEDTEDDFVSCGTVDSEDEDEDVNLLDVQSVLYELRKELKEFKIFSVDTFRKACALEKKLANVDVTFKRSLR